MDREDPLFELQTTEKKKTPLPNYRDSQGSEQ